MNVEYSKPIPVTADPTPSEAVAFEEEPMVFVEPSGKIDIKMMYPILGFRHGDTRCMLRETVYRMLMEAADLLPEGYLLRVWDAWRPFALQQELFDVYSVDIEKEFHLEDLSPEEREAFIARFVSVPIPDRTLPPLHTTGGAVDVTILDPDGNELAFGCAFDAFTEKTRTAYYEGDASVVSPEAAIYRDNRRMLYNVMVAAGFTNLPSEWWHFDYGDKVWSAITGRPAKYRGEFLIP
jgi:D-alanyl-D-alanine dipeptidase